MSELTNHSTFDKSEVFKTNQDGRRVSILHWLCHLLTLLKSEMASLSAIRQKTVITRFLYNV